MTKAANYTPISSLGFKACEPDLPLLPEGCLGAAAGLLEVGLLLCGGLRDGKTASNSCWLLRLGSSSRWERADSLPQATAFPAYSVLADHLYVAGGVTNLEMAALNTVQAYSSKDGWSTLAPLPTPRYGGCALAHPGDAIDPTGYLLVVGGWDPKNMKKVESVQTKVEVYSATRRRWKELAVETSWKGGMGISCTTGSGPLDTTSMALVGGVQVKRVDGVLAVQPVSSITRLHFNGTRMPADAVPSPEVVLQPGVGWLGENLLVVGTRHGKLLKSGEEGNEWEEVDPGSSFIREMAVHIVLHGKWASDASCKVLQGKSFF